MIASPHPLAGAYACSGLGEQPAQITFEHLTVEKGLSSKGEYATADLVKH
jgi:hypothetical protein